ncbi:MAG: Gfo/Idh/MocA family oxidoreductase [Candidatus Latescibacterota bacterium]|nr:Gfo/Idh/MocA family oxidoreductase [Candidatus Latescibacterota bacterium]
MFKCAIIGVSGGRAHGHAEAFAHISRGEIVAVSSRQADKLRVFADRFSVSSRYIDYQEMLVREKPDVVLVNTPPDVRLEIFRAADESGVPGIIVEKPLATEGEDFQAMSEFARDARVKIAVNHQLHFQPRRSELQRRVADGAIGEVRFIDASAGMNLAYQGTHALQAVQAFYPQGIPASVFAQVSGVEGLQDTPRKHFAPDRCVAAIGFADGVSAQLQCGPQAPRVGRETVNTHKRIAVYGTRGFVHWTMWGWEMNVDGDMEAGEHEYGEEDILGQAAMTDAMFAWLDGGPPHPLRLKMSLRDFNIILGIFTSALNREVVDLPVEPAPRLIHALRRELE